MPVSNFSGVLMSGMRVIRNVFKKRKKYFRIDFRPRLLFCFDSKNKRKEKSSRNSRLDVAKRNFFKVKRKIAFDNRGEKV